MRAIRNEDDRIAQVFADADDPTSDPAEVLCPWCKQVKPYSAWCPHCHYNEDLDAIIEPGTVKDRTGGDADATIL